MAEKSKESKEVKETKEKDTEKKPAPKKKANSKLEITLVKSLTGRKQKHIATAVSLGLKKIGSKTVQPDNPQTRGKIAHIGYLVNVIEVK